MTTQTQTAHPTREEWIVHEMDKLDELLADAEIDIADHTRQAMLIQAEANKRFPK